MDLTFFPKEIFIELAKLNLDNLTEIRLRINYPILITYNGIRDNLLSNNKVIIATKRHVDEIIQNITEKSIYAFNNNIKQGFLTTKDGVRVGLSGKCVFENSNLVTISEFSSLNVRIPHLVKDCSDDIFPYIFQENNLLNSLIVSVPAKGKTTLLKDITLKLNQLKYGNILVIDERNEFSCINGEYIDKITYSDKYYAFSYGLRSMSPEIIITDELSSESDWNFAKSSINSGIKLIASCHANTKEELINKNYFIKNIFDRYIFLKNHQIAGVLDKVYDREFNML